MEQQISSIWANYPPAAQHQLHVLRELAFSVAEDVGGGASLTENVKWGQASYAYPGGSPVRMDWHQSSPDSVWLFFHCQSKLVPVFRARYPDAFRYHGSRAIELPLEGKWDTAALTDCLQLAFRYHAIKHLPLLGHRAG